MREITAKQKKRVISVALPGSIGLISISGLAASVLSAPTPPVAIPPIATQPTASPPSTTAPVAIQAIIPISNFAGSNINCGSSEVITLTGDARLIQTSSGFGRGQTTFTINYQGVGGIGLTGGAQYSASDVGGSNIALPPTGAFDQSFPASFRLSGGANNNFVVTFSLHLNRNSAGQANASAVSSSFKCA